MTVGEVKVYPDERAAARAAAERFVAAAAEALVARGRFSVALTGGGSPREVFRLLAGELRDRVDWRRVHLYWGDERCVPPAHPRSNYGMAHRLLIRHLPVPHGNVHRIRGELGAAAAAADYERTLRETFSDWPPVLDLVHLGVGDDGHVASLFPFDRERLLERRRVVAPSLRLPLGEPRVTLTYAALNAAREVHLLLQQPAKAEIARRVLCGPLDPVRLPAQGVRPAGALRCYLSEASARRLPSGAR